MNSARMTNAYRQPSMNAPTIQSPTVGMKRSSRILHRRKVNVQEVKVSGIKRFAPLVLVPPARGALKIERAEAFTTSRTDSVHDHSP